MDNEVTDRIDNLLNTPYWIIDILPMQVPKDSPGQYFAVEAYYLKERLAAIKQRHINVILKLNCYMDIEIDGKTNPAPSKIVKLLNKRYTCIMIGNSMILSEPDDTHMTLFNPDERLLELVRDLSTAEGLFLWKGEN